MKYLINIFERFEDRCISTPLLNGLPDAYIYLFINHYFSSNTTFSTYTNSNRLDNYKNTVAL